MTNATAVVGKKIREVLDGDAHELVAAYYDPDRPFAGDLFDSFGSNPSNKFISDDLVAASLLDIRFGPDAVRGLLGRESGTIQRQLKAIPKETRLWDDSDLTPAYTLWESLVNLDGVGPTKASKLLARKRPHLMPVVDSVIRTNLGLGRADAWTALREVLSDAMLRAAIDALAPSGQNPSTLRLLDVAVWMRFSESTNARTVREDLGIKVSKRVAKIR